MVWCHRKLLRYGDFPGGINGGYARLLVFQWTQEEHLVVVYFEESLALGVYCHLERLFFVFFVAREMLCRKRLKSGVAFLVRHLVVGLYVQLAGGAGSPAKLQLLGQQLQ